MTDPGLTNRLRHHSRRAGIAVGVSMALTIAILIAGFAVIYAQLAPLTSDFVADIEPTPEPRLVALDVDVDIEPTPRPAVDADQAAPALDADQAPAAQPTPTPDVTPTPAAFSPTHQSNSRYSINFRAGPSRDFDRVTVLPPATPIEYLGEEAPTEDPAADGDRWMKFRTEDGDEGWIREIDAETFDADA